MIYHIMRIGLITSLMNMQLHASLQSAQSSQAKQPSNLAKVPVVKPQFFDVPLGKAPQTAQSPAQGTTKPVQNIPKIDESSGCKGMCTLQ